MNLVSTHDFLHRLLNKVKEVFSLPVYFGWSPQNLPGRGVVFFPLHTTLFCCGLAGIVSYKKKQKDAPATDGKQIEPLLLKVQENGYAACVKNTPTMETNYLGGDDVIDALADAARSLKTDETFFAIYIDDHFQADLRTHCRLLDGIIAKEGETLAGQLGAVEAGPGRIMVQRLEALKDISWCLKSEILDNIDKIRELQTLYPQKPQAARTLIFKKINAVLNNIDRLEVRGRDSAGISLMFWIKPSDFEQFEARLSDPDHKDLYKSYQNRMKDEVLVNQSIRVSHVETKNGESLTAVALVYKFASEVGCLGDNIAYLRRQIQSDAVLQILTEYPVCCDLVSAHTRWASVGAINECNCHPVDNQGSGNNANAAGIIYVCLNGDIDNYLELKKELQEYGRLIHEEVTTDTKIIPLLIEKHMHDGDDVAEAFRKTVNLFDGSHAITMHTDREPGKLFLAQKGSGQALFIGLAKDFWLASSEVYGFVEETDCYWKMDGEKVVDGKNGKTQGQIAVLDQNCQGGISNIRVCYYDQTPVVLTEKDIRKTRITSRDIDRQGFSHYYLKEISEAPASVEKTLENRWKISTDEDSRYGIELDEKTIPVRIQNALKAREIRRIFFVGQGTAGVAAKVCANLFATYLNDPKLLVASSKASEFSGFMISDMDDQSTFKDALVIAVSQSGTTADTNRTVDMVKKRGAYTLAIVNRRDLDITYKVDGVMYTSTGRDIEMSVASTKAFYSQIVAGALLGLYVASIMGMRNEAYVGNEIKNLLALPEKMRKVLANREEIRESANRTASAKTYWAVVGSGPNKASADEIRIKLSELCYKTISTDYVEDKKHIDLSSEPLIIVCAAGTRPKVISDIVKDCAIFQAHKAAPIVIADEGEHRFDPYAVDVFHVPSAPEHLSPVLNTLAGHLWGYYAALAIHEGSAFLHRFREDIRRFLDEQSEKGLDVYEIILDKTFREKIAAFYYEFRKQKAHSRLPAVMEIGAVSDLTLLLKYLSGRLPASDFELDFGIKGTAMNMLNALFECIGASINVLSRPVDAIKHQAKTVTVGTSRISEKVEGLLFDILKSHKIGVSRLTNNNVMVLKNLQEVIGTVNGTIDYKIDGLDLLGEPTERTTISVIEKTGILKSIPSRVETDVGLKGTKRIIVRQGNVYIGKGRKDDRSILVIPVISSDPDLPNRIEHLLLFNISFKDKISIRAKVKALGGKYEHIKNIVQENSLTWKDEYLDIPEIGELFGRSAEKIAEFIASRV